MFSPSERRLSGRQFMSQIGRDSKRAYVANSLQAVWDDIF